MWPMIQFQTTCLESKSSYISDTSLRSSPSSTSFWLYESLKTLLLDSMFPLSNNEMIPNMQVYCNKSIRVKLCAQCILRTLYYGFFKFHRIVLGQDSQEILPIGSKKRSLEKNTTLMPHRGLFRYYPSLRKSKEERVRCSLLLTLMFSAMMPGSLQMDSMKKTYKRKRREIFSRELYLVGPNIASPLLGGSESSLGVSLTT